MKKECLVFIGDWPQNIIEKVQLFSHLEKKFQCRVHKESEFRYSVQIKGHLVTFQFCFGPKDDIIWEERRKIRETPEYKMPFSIERLHTQGIDAKVIYYFGFCGVFRGRLNSIFLPTLYKEILFNDVFLNAKSVSKAKITKSLKFDNSLINIVHGITCSDITSNHVLSLRYVEDKSENILKKLSTELSTKADIVEMEGYEILKLYGAKFKGSFYYGSDNPLIKKKMLGNNKTALTTDYTKFISTSLQVLDSICN